MLVKTIQMCWIEYGAAKNSLTLLVEMQNGTATLENCLVVFLYKVTHTAVV